jgi:hypothetical protein
VTEGEGHNTARGGSLQYWSREEQELNPCPPLLSSPLVEIGEDGTGGLHGAVVYKNRELSLTDASLFPHLSIIRISTLFDTLFLTL